MKSKKTVSDKTRVTQLLNFLNLGFKDYLGARTLINNGLNLQGAILASTAIEKYFKAIIAINGHTSKGHLKDSLLNTVKNFDPKLYSAFNQSFLTLLKEIYQLRYYDNEIKVGFSINVCDKQFLAELDYSISEMQKRIELNINGKKLETAFDVCKNNNDPLLFNNNYLLLNIDKTAFIEQENSVYAVLFDSNVRILEVHYKTIGVKNDGDFMKPGITADQKTPNQSLKLTLQRRLAPVR